MLNTTLARRSADEDEPEDIAESEQGHNGAMLERIDANERGRGVPGTGRGRVCAKAPS